MFLRQPPRKQNHSQVMPKESGQGTTHQSRAAEGEVTHPGVVFPKFEFTVWSQQG
jgi:hypothetical protein